MTKEAEDELVRNKDRALIANRARAALMIRLHCDASQERGYAVYYPDRQGRARDGTVGPTPDVIEESRRAAEAVHTALAEDLAGALNDNGVRTDYQTRVGREQGGALTGSIFSEVPVVTIEMVVLSNPSDADFIKTDDGQRRMAESIADGVTSFVGSGNKPVPLQEKEIKSIQKQIKAEAPKVRVEYQVGENVRVIDGPFSDFHGKVDEINADKGKLKVLVNMFGRETPVELDLLQVERLK